jgi:predicted lipoprotein
MSRRPLLFALCLAAVPGPLALGCRRARSQSDVLTSLVEDVHARDMQAVVKASRTLATASAKLAAAPGGAEIHAVRDAWRGAAIAWKRAHALRSGPVVDTNALLRSTFWPARPAAIDATLKSSTPLDAALVDASGVDVRGIYGLEYLLFDRENGVAAPARVAGAGGDRARAYAALCAAGVAKYAELALSGVGSKGERYAPAFAAAGQKSVNRVVGHLVEAIESLAENRIALLLWMDRIGRVKPADVEGFPSGTSKELALAAFAGVEELYTGGNDAIGLGALVAPAVSAVDDEIRSRFGAARLALSALDGPLEKAVKSERAKVETVRTTLKSLEIALKTDLTSALGVTLTFSSTDGD